MSEPGADSVHSCLARLDRRQRTAAADTEGYVAIQACPGAGKTAVIAARVALLLEKGISPGSILCFTFTNKAADEMRCRIRGCSGRSADEVRMRTFHSICAGLLRQHGSVVGVPHDFGICSENKAKRLLRKAIRRVGLSNRFSESDIRSYVSFLKLKGVDGHPPVRTHASVSRACGESIFSAYQDELGRHGLLDFDDLVAQTLQLLRQHTYAAGNISSQIRYVLVDEFQDTSDTEFEIIRALASAHGNLCVVADTNQAIYAFRDANCRLMVEFPVIFPDARVHRLDTNYRSCECVVEASERLIRFNNADPGFTVHRTERGYLGIRRCESDTLEATDIARTIGFLTTEPGLKLSDIAVLYRQHWVSRTMEDVFSSAGIPFRVVASDDYDAYDAVVDCLRCAAMPDSRPLAADPDLIEKLRSAIGCRISLHGLLRMAVNGICGPDWQSQPEKLGILEASAGDYEGAAADVLPAFLESIVHQGMLRAQKPSS